MDNLNPNRTLLYGEGLFETIHWVGVNRRLRRHYNRLRASADFLSLPCPTFEDFVSSIESATGGKRPLYVKYCLLSEGEGLFYRGPNSSKTLIITGPMPDIPKNVRLTYSPYRRHSTEPNIYHKCTNYLFNVLVKREALSRGFYDAIILNEHGLLTECSASNILLIKDSRYLTPKPQCGLLWGTTLSVLADNLPIELMDIGPELLQDAHEVYVLNSLIGALPVTAIEGKVFGLNPKRQSHLTEILRSEEH
jgi:4-amino-4-deoxychorismate lyase